MTYNQIYNNLYTIATTTTTQPPSTTTPSTTTTISFNFPERQRPNQSHQPLMLNSEFALPTYEASTTIT